MGRLAGCFIVVRTCFPLQITKLPRQLLEIIIPYPSVGPVTAPPNSKGLSEVPASIFQLAHLTINRISRGQIMEAAEDCFQAFLVAPDWVHAINWVTAEEQRDHMWPEWETLIQAPAVSLICLSWTLCQRSWERKGQRSEQACSDRQTESSSHWDSRVTLGPLTLCISQVSFIFQFYGKYIG